MSGASRADDGHAFHAPDGITILPFALPGLAHLSFVEGRIPPRPEPYPIHLHGALEQITYVLAGRIAVTTWDADAGNAATFAAIPGDAFVTLPRQTLAFANAGPEEARVLFICAPAYPPDDSDTRLVTAHHAPTVEEIAWSRERHRAALDAFAAIARARTAVPGRDATG
ncbi:MAG: cupin domain-containing protein [Chloroflexota bacterium]|nr:cupin domain-containing protein [Chloroflexota bacterium]MDQ6907071.1 cupin domain-containing protein [Chloroflexota bacterium]